MMTDKTEFARPVALYLSKPAPLSPNWEEFERCVSDHHLPVMRWDPTQSFENQIQDVLVVVDDGGTQGTRAMIDASVAAGVKLWHVTTNGLDHVDVGYFLQKGMPLAHAGGPQSAVALAEHAHAVILYFGKNLHRNKAQNWTDRAVNEELEGRTLGLLGLGASGRELAKRANMLGMRLIAVDALPVSEQVQRECKIAWFGNPGQLQQLAAASDFLSIHVPFTAKTRRMINREILDQMKPSAVLINVARGEIVDETALIASLQAGRLRGAGLDVFDPEPPEPTNPLLNMSNVIATPHIAGATDGTFRRRAKAAAENVFRVVNGLLPLDLVTTLE